ncbi:transposase IS4 family protein [Acidovorax delafieldii 2AN]|uniref:Transposase IS4 family protein n=1 Tax=Acidovorax delafieldii 2AN TaxID=573060 RepID=C5T3Q2_ACIDE|nr:IS4 family transposase [Acidovorax delafieldii]EER60915.1 transposase IS4 family protein [Acidovorax delafieldii 2AN]
MSLLQTTLNETLETLPANAIAELSALLDPAWIAQALQATGKASMRRRKLPAEHAVWLVIGLALFRHMPLWQVVQEMALTLDGQELPAPSVSVQVRQRLGAEPMEHMFGLLANAWGRAHAVHAGALRVLAVDGVAWSAPDSKDNRQELGSGQTQYGPQPWPMVRAVCLLDTDSHELLDAQLGDYGCGELTLAADLHGLDHSITLFDRAYFSAAFLLAWSQAGQQRHWLMRAKDNLRYEVVQTLDEGDWLIRMPVSPRARKLHPQLPSHWQARLIEVRAGGKVRRFITSMLDPEQFAAAPLAQLYRQRWEIELGFREIKQSLQQGQAVLRSKQPELVKQEVWGVLIAYTLLRRWMRLMAEHEGVEPTRISFHTARHAIVGAINTVHLARAGTVPALLQRLLEQTRYFVLPPRREGRSFPREVKRSRSKFPTKKCQSAA